MHKLGVIGGLGPMATALFMEYVIEMTDASTDAEHIEMLIHNCPQIPDRTAYILGNSTQSPAPHMIDSGLMLQQNGCDLISIPCITANYFYNEISEAVNIPILDGVKETAAVINSYNTNHTQNKITTVGIIATDGTIKSQLFQNALNKYNLATVIPESEDQEQIMSLIYDDVKGGRKIDNATVKRLESIAAKLYEKGAEIVILGCTELSVIGQRLSNTEGYADALRALAQSTVLACGKLKPQYNAIIQPKRKEV